MTEEEKNLALELFEKHKEAFEAIFTVLQDTGELESPSSAKPLKIKIEDKTIEGETVREFYEKILEYLIKERLIDRCKLPYATGTKRYLISKEPKHQAGHSFRVSVKVSDYYMEAHKSRAGAMKDLIRFLQDNKIRFSINK